MVVALAQLAALVLRRGGVGSWGPLGAWVQGAARDPRRKEVRAVSGPPQTCFPQNLPQNQAGEVVSREFGGGRWVNGGFEAPHAPFSPNLAQNEVGEGD